MFLADFGISVEAYGHYSAISGVNGTFAYMAPEMIDDRARITAAVDVWAAAGSILEMLTGQAPFAGRQIQHIMAALTRREHPSLDSPLVSPGMRSFLEQCFQADPAARPSPVQALETLRGLLHRPSPG